MAESWAADVKKYVPDANDKAISGIVKYCGIALQNRHFLLNSSRTRRRWRECAITSLRKKLGLTH